MSQLPKRCKKCKASEFECRDSGITKPTEYRETFECLVCGYCWDNVFVYKGSVRSSNTSEESYES